MMPIPLPRLQALLLDILSTERSVDPQRVAALGESDWVPLLAAARQHRLLPLLHWRLTRERTGLPVPRTVRDALAADFKRWTLRALLMQRELLLVHRFLHDADIPHIALKGAYLAFHAYPHPALRPMRDLDILVPMARVHEAFGVLIENGFTRPRQFRGDLDAALRIRNHVPPLHSASGRVCVELHARLTDPAEGLDRPDLIDDERLWERTLGQKVAESRLLYLLPTDLLLHLIEHAVYRHRFDNGPLVLSDLAYLLEGHAIDWPLFWSQTERHGQTRGTWLLLKMVERYFGRQPIEWPAAAHMDPGTAAPVMEAASLLTLRDFTARADTGMETEVGNQTSLRGKFGVLFHRAFPPKRTIAALHPVSEDSALVYLWYVIRLWRLLTARLPEYLRNRRTEHSREEARRLFVLEQWLQDGPEATDT